MGWDVRSLRRPGWAVCSRVWVPATHADGDPDAHGDGDADDHPDAHADRDPDGNPDRYSDDHPDANTSRRLLQWASVAGLR